MELFRDCLDELCRTSGVQYAELARRVGVTKSYIGQLVHGHSKPPPPERCDQIADALELSPADRHRLLDLAVRERARLETRVRLEKLHGDVRALRSAAAESLIGLLAALASRDSLPEPVADLTARDHLLADLLAIANSDEGDAAAELAERLDDVSAERLAALTAALRAAAADTEPTASTPPPRPPIPIIGHVAAGQTDIAFTDAGLPTGAGLPGEEPLPRWPGASDHAYALRISGDSMKPACPPGTIIVVEPDRSPLNGELAICQTTEDKSYFKIVHLEAGGAVRLVSTNTAVAPDIVLKRSQVRRLQKVIATIHP